MDRKKLIKAEVVDLFKTSKETLRHYEKKGLIKPEIGPKGYRYYDVEEMNKLRQIFLLRDLGFGLDQMNMMFSTDLQQVDYKDKLIEQTSFLEEKINHYKNILDHVHQVLEVLECHEFSLSFRLKTLPARSFITFNPFESDFLGSLKAYYDQFKDIITHDFYSERRQSSLFNYSDLDDFNKEHSLMAVEVSDTSKVTPNKTFAKGLYLSVFYIFTDNDFTSLNLLKGAIDTYLVNHDYRIKNPLVLEIEHPEFKMILPKGASVYEIQIEIESTH